MASRARRSLRLRSSTSLLTSPRYAMRDGRAPAAGASRRLTARTRPGIVFRDDRYPVARPARSRHPGLGRRARSRRPLRHGAPASGGRAAGRSSRALHRPGPRPRGQRPPATDREGDGLPVPRAVRGARARGAARPPKRQPRVCRLPAQPPPSCRLHGMRPHRERRRSRARADHRRRPGANRLHARLSPDRALRPLRRVPRGRVSTLDPSHPLRLVWRPTLRLASASRWVVASLAAGLIVIACSGPSGGSGPSAASSALPSAFAAAGTPAAGGPPIAVVGTENFYADLLAEIGGARVSAQSFLNDPNADPHAFESSPRGAQIVPGAQLVIVNGIGYDAFMVRLLAAAPDPARIVIDVQQLLGLPDDANVHVWYDPATMPKVAAAAEAALARLEPANAPYFAARAQAYLKSLEPITAVIASLHARYAGTPVAFTEDVAGYLTDRIGLVVKRSEERRVGKECRSRW